MTEHDTALDETKPDDTSEKAREVHKTAMRRFDDAVLPQLEQRALCLFARRFASIPGAQWEGEWGDQFENSIKVEVNKVAAGLEKIERDYRDNRIVPDFRPSGGDSDPETADTLDGMHRADGYTYKAQQGRDNAFAEASSGGFGAYRLTNEWADPYDKDSDEQRINPALTIVDADQRVFFDPNSKLYDKSDARYAFVLTAKSPEAFKEDHGEEQPTSWPDMALRTSHYDWYAPEVVMVAEYYLIEDKAERLLIFEHGISDEEERWWSSEITSEEVRSLITRGFRKREQRRQRKRVRKYTLSGEGVLADHGYLAGDCIPIVPVYGKRWYIDNLERFRGYVQLKMDAQRLYNAKVSKLSEEDALAPREKPIFAAEQMPPALQALWERQEIDRHPYALVNPLLDRDGNIVSAGPIGKITPPSPSPVTAALLQIANQDLLEGQQDADEVVANTSAEAMDMAATRIDAKSAIYLDNMRQSVQREGEIYLSMARDVYWEPGRKVETMTEDGDDGEAVLQESVTDKKTGLNRIRNDFTKGRYKVIADVTEATATRRDKTVKSSLGIAEKAMAAGDTELAQAALITAVVNQDGEGMDDMRRFARQRGIQIGLVEPNEEEQQAMAQAAEQAGPDPAQAVLAAQAEALKAGAVKDEALAEKAGADTALSEAKVVQTLADAAKKQAEARAPASSPANDRAPIVRPRIRLGRD